VQAGGAVASGRSVISDLDAKPPILLSYTHRRRAGARVPGHGGQRLGNDGVRGCLHRWWRSRVHVDAEFDRDGAPLGDTFQCDLQSAAEDRRVQTACDFTQLRQGGGELFPAGGEDLGCAARVGIQPHLRQPEHDGHCDQTLLGTVMQVALQPAARRIAGVDDAGSRVAQLFQLGPQLGLEPFVLQCQAGCAANRTAMVSARWVLIRAP
jgi:hypothetical protein